MTMQLLDASPLWPATLDHIRYDSPDAARLADFYSRTMGMAVSYLSETERPSTSARYSLSTRPS